MSCQDDSKLMELIAEKVIRDLIDSHVIQEAVKDCAGEWLNGGSTVARCTDIPDVPEIPPLDVDGVKDVVCNMLENGQLCFAKPETFAMDCDTKELVLSLSDGSEIKANLNCEVGVNRDN